MLFGGAFSAVVHFLKPKLPKDQAVVSRSSLKTMQEIAYLDGTNSGLQIAMKLAEGKKGEEVEKLAKDLEDDCFTRYEERIDKTYFNKYEKSGT